MTSKISLSEDLPAPMLAAEVAKLPARKASGKIQAGLAEKLGDQPPEMETIDGRRYPKGCQAVAVPAMKGADADRALAGGTEGYVPDHADVDFTARLEPRAMRLPKFIERTEFMGGEVGAKTIFGADDRRVYYSTAYPWRCVGKVETALGSGSGVMVGPRHLLTCSHVIDWRADGSVGWVKFTPMYYNGSAPYGSAFSTRVYFKHKVQGPTIDGTEAKYDYVALVLDRNIGSATGWMGTKSYTDSWDGSAYWTHAGYPGDLTGGQRPTYQNSVALDGDFWSADSHEAMSHKADVWPGQSGGPFWGYWSSQPYVVAVQSSQNASVNNASGGSDMVDLVVRARAEFP